MTGLNPNQGPDAFDQALAGLARLNDRDQYPMAGGDLDEAEEEQEIQESVATPEALPPENLSPPLAPEPSAVLPPPPPPPRS